MRPPDSREVPRIMDRVYDLIRANRRAEADKYLRQAVHIGVSPVDLIMEATRREPLE